MIPIRDSVIFYLFTYALNISPTVKVKEMGQDQLLRSRVGSCIGLGPSWSSPTRHTRVHPSGNKIMLFWLGYSSDRLSCFCIRMASFMRINVRWEIYNQSCQCGDQARSKYNLHNLLYPNDNRFRCAFFARLFSHIMREICANLCVI